jgi:hypothetical protein
MDNKLETKINNENLMPKLKTPSIIYVLSGIVVFLIIMMFFIMNDVSLTKFSSTNKSQQQIVADTFIILFFSILVVGICIIFLPNLKEFKELFQQINSVTYVFLYTIFAVLFYTLMSPGTINSYYYIINPVLLGLGALSFYMASKQNYVENFNIQYERIKMLIMIFCFLTLMITFYNVNPGDAAGKYFGYSLLLTIIISVFAFLYLMIILTMNNKETSSSSNLLNNFSLFGTYGSALFIFFLLTMTTIISYNKDNFFANKEKSASIILMLLFICILWSSMIGINLFDGFGNKFADNEKVTFLKKGLLGVFGLVISGLIIYWIAYNLESLSGKSSSVSFLLNLLLVIVILGLIYKTVHVKLPQGQTKKKNAFFNLILSILFYIPCLLSDGFDWIGKIAVGQYNSTEAGSFLMLILAIILILLYFKTPSLFNHISKQGGKQLINKPVYTNTQYNLGNYQELNGTDNYDYQFAISSWIFIDAVPPNTNPNYTKFTSLLNFGNKPNILYNPSKNTLMITMQQKDLKNKTENKLIDFDDDGNRIIYLDKGFLLQKWNNIIINYNGGTMDVFLNGELVKSSIEVVPYYTYDNLTIGEEDGIRGGICNVIYFKKPLTANNIYYLYNTVKNRNPPTLNDSNETILVKPNT